MPNPTNYLNNNLNKYYFCYPSGDKKFNHSYTTPITIDSASNIFTDIMEWTDIFRSDITFAGPLDRFLHQYFSTMKATEKDIENAIGQVNYFYQNGKFMGWYISLSDASRSSTHYNLYYIDVELNRNGNKVEVSLQLRYLTKFEMNTTEDKFEDYHKVYPNSDVVQMMIDGAKFY